MLTLAFVTGTQPGKWFTRYREGGWALEPFDTEDAVGELLAGTCQLALARIPATGTDPRIDDTFHLVRLYEEKPGVAVPKDSVFAELGEKVDPADLAGEIVNYAPTESPNVEQVRQALQIVAANVGVAFAPHPLLKNLSKKLVVPLELEVGEEHPRTIIALVWRKEDDNEAIQQFVGVSRGRTSGSSRGDKVKLSAREKSRAKQARRAAANGGGKVKKKQTLQKRKKVSQRGKRR